MNLFEQAGLSTPVDSGAEFSSCRKYRYALWRIWNSELPLVAFIGLNPSKANEIETDRTVSTVMEYAKRWGKGGFYMMNCFAFVSTKPELLVTSDPAHEMINQNRLQEVGEKCDLIIFAWGAFKIVKEKGMDTMLSKIFPEAKALRINNDGSPHHPLYLGMNIIPKKFELKK